MRAMESIESKMIDQDKGRIIITGGTGLIGRALARQMAGDGYEVVLLSRSPERAAGLPQGVRAEKWDAVSADGWGHLADGAKAIINLAGESIAGERFLPGKWTLERKQLILDSRVNAGKAVVAAVAAAASKPELVVQSSAVGYYGPLGDKPVSEDAPAGDDFLAKVTIAWEASTQAVEAAGVRRAVARIGLVFDKKGGSLYRLMLPFKLYAGGPLGSGGQIFSWIHIADLVNALQFLVETPEAHGPFNLTAPNPVSSEQLAHAIGKVMGRPAFIPAPAFALKLLLGEVATVVLTGQNALPDRLHALGYRFKYRKVRDALANLI